MVQWTEATHGYPGQPLSAAGPVAAGQQCGSLLVWNVSHTGPDRQLE
jgi:hypothetical protein